MVAGLFLTYDNCPESENYWSQKYSGKNEKMLSFFLFSYKMITTTNYNTQKISLGSIQNKKLREGIEYQNIPILYDGKRSIVHLCGRFKLEEDVSFDSSPNYSNSLGVDVDDDNRKLFEDFEEKLQSLTGDGELKLIKYDRVYLKIYVNDKGEMAPKFWEVFCEDGKSGSSEQSSKEYKKPVWDKESLLGKYIEGEVVFSISNIFVGKSQSIICVAKEILVREIIEEERSLFCKIPCFEKKLKLRNDNAFFVFQRIPLKYIFFS